MTVTCALSGLQPLPHELSDDEDAEFGEEETDDLPIGWTEVRLRRRVHNDRWDNIQDVKNGLVATALASATAASKRAKQDISAAELASTEEALRIQVDAQFAALENRTPRFLTQEVTVRMAPAYREVDAPGLTEAQQSIFVSLGVEWENLTWGDEEEDGNTPTG